MSTNQPTTEDRDMTPKQAMRRLDSIDRKKAALAVKMEKLTEKFTAIAAQLDELNKAQVEALAAALPEFDANAPAAPKPARKPRARKVEQVQPVEPPQTPEAEYTPVPVEELPTSVYEIACSVMGKRLTKWSNDYNELQRAVERLEPQSILEEWQVMSNSKVTARIDHEIVRDFLNACVWLSFKDPATKEHLKEKYASTARECIVIDPVARFKSMVDDAILYGISKDSYMHEVILETMKNFSGGTQTKTSEYYFSVLYPYFKGK